MIPSCFRHPLPIVTSLLLLIGTFASPGFAAELFVHHTKGRDSSIGTREEPVQSLQRAIRLAEPGDQITLLPAGAIYRQAATLNGQTDLTIEGNGVTLEGADSLPTEGWELVRPGLNRRRLPRPQLDRHLLIIDGVAQRMGRTQSSAAPPFPTPDELKEGEFCFETIDEEAGWLYVRGSLENLEWAVRPNGIATGGTCERITIRNLNARHFLNDGFNIHGRCTGFVCENIQGYDCFDEGFSAHDLCECTIRKGSFWGNDNGIADVNEARTTYYDSVFYGNVNNDVLLLGVEHCLENCQIRNETTAAALVGGPRGMPPGPFELKLVNLRISGLAESPARVRLNGGTVHFQGGQLENVSLNLQGAEVVGEIPAQ
ncbi:right-handed parallel beta-helix repeat-containing protein [Rubinisphaera margarita]|uniref:right-handed parallel beta-helix repeat-containing protein n=1 Tax=Rubinisphaera margarita TaxID=2909586 RepID=UPI001EE88412|nr:right-handed parallel beta-helix repeat-containing protein [Rubinisphaera margarita]MCG6155436.1 right-handed parallel beta-helix repeat-containing protein [Rubinisphaera margarita]